MYYFCSQSQQQLASQFLQCLAAYRLAFHSPSLSSFYLGAMMRLFKTVRCMMIEIAPFTFVAVDVDVESDEGREEEVP